LHDHLNKEKYETPAENYDKYLFYNRQKNKAGALGYLSEQRTTITAANSIGVKAMEYDESERQRLELSGILSSSINDFSAMQNRLQSEGENVKISNQNALLSLLSHDDFTELKKQIHTKITTEDQSVPADQLS